MPAVLPDKPEVRDDATPTGTNSSDKCCSSGSAAAATGARAAGSWSSAHSNSSPITGPGNGRCASRDKASPADWHSNRLGFSVAVESGAGDAANFADDTYRAAGAEVVPVTFCGPPKSTFDADQNR